MSKQPIGVFDSGLGGISVLNELVKQMPNESFLYFGDNAFCPYGEKSVNAIQIRSKKITDWMIDRQCKMIVVACNTATAAAIEVLRKSYPIPFIGMEPAVKPAALQTKTNCIGILATKGTFQGRLFKNTSLKFAAHIEVIIQSGDGLVEIVEAGEANSKKAYELLLKYCEPMLRRKADHIVLGCTHYPFLISQLTRVVRHQAKIINPAPAVAKHAAYVLQQLNLLSKTAPSTIGFYSSGEMPMIPFYFESRIRRKKTYQDMIML